jgi:NTE family protein
MAGLASGQRRGGIGLAGAGLTVGTSAGAIIAALLATGQDLDRPADPSPAGDPGIPAPRVDGARVGEVFQVLGDPDEGGVASARSRSWLRPAARRPMLAAWPTCPAAATCHSALLIPAVDAQTGDLRVF